MSEIKKIIVIIVTAYAFAKSVYLYTENYTESLDLSDNYFDLLGN